MDAAGNVPGADSVDGGPELSGIVIAPAHPGDERAEVVFEVRPGVGGADVLPVFSSVGQLVQTFGPAQPWVALPLRKVRELAYAGGVRQVVLDPVVPPSAWRWQYSDLEALGRDPG